MNALQGTWDIVTLELEGRAQPAAVLAGARIVLDGESFRTESMGAGYEGRYAVDTTRTPHTIDVTFTEGPHAGRKSLGIFRLEGDEWTLCLGMAGATRPAAFVTTPGSSHALETLRRATPGRGPRA